MALRHFARDKGNRGISGMSAELKPLLTAEEYLAIERRSETKHEFYRGEMFAMSGASRKHNLITFNLAGIFHSQIKDRDCDAYISDMRVQVASTSSYVYPDAVVTCEHPQFEDGHLDTLLNPMLVVEVLSETTENYDRGKKFERYRKIGSLREYLLISQDRAHIEHFVRHDDGNWLMSDVSGLGAIVELSSVKCELALADIYAKVELPLQAE
jgi:Uma2 family endonuclease